MNILVTGANGQLGNGIRKAAAASRHNFIYTDVHTQDGVETLPLDICDRDAVNAMLREKNIDCIINCAAYTNVDRAETDEELCYMLNAVAPMILAKAVKAAGGLLVHISTDYVFGADPYNTPCREEQKGNPTGVYGKTKAEGESFIEASGCDYVILRTAWLYSEYGKNFVKTMLGLTSTREHLKVVFDQCGTPTYANDLAGAIMVIVNDYASRNERPYSRTGIYNYSNEGVCSWYDFARRIAHIAGHTACDIQPCHSSEFPSPVVRPSYSVLDKSKIKSVFGIRIPYWMDSLEICINNLLER